MSDMRSSKELVKSLRDYSEGPTFYWGPICQKAAEEIERLQRELAASAAQYQEACDDANRFARERDEARASSEPRGIREALQSAADALRNMGCAFDADEAEEALRATPPPSAVPALRAALVHAVSVIQTWHNMGIPKKDRSALWDIYWRNSPEMQPIRAELTKEAGQ
jgi:hypothetical protein